MKITQIKDVGSIFTDRASQGVAQIVPGIFCQDPEGTGKRCYLYVHNKIMMTDSTFERDTNRQFIQEARGNVLIAGLGLGLLLNNILDKPEVLSVTVIEKYKDVIDIVAHKYNNAKLRVVNADIFHWTPEHDQKFDSIYFDIWPEIIEENLVDIQVLEDRFRKHLAPGGNIDSWMKEHLIEKYK